MISPKPQDTPASDPSQDQSTMETENPTDSSLVLNLPKYIGLPNQGATCYMNSLLQTLFMTPEFRSALYGWKYDENRDARPEDCIPFQLQKLFASLQLKLASGVSTKPLTKSFQWQESTSFEQHDIQEFSSLLFDAIDQSVKDIKTDSFIDDLFEGTTVNYVKCLECGYESSRPENFLNIGLTVKNEFDKIYNDSLQKALQIYLKPEKLEGPNQYFCEVCNKKVDATKGTKFVKAPKLMNMIINRFSFDFVYMRRVKLDDKFTFPFILNMNDYINGYEGIKNKVSEESTPEYFNEYVPPKKTVNKTTTTKKTTTTANKQGVKNVAGKPVRSNIRSFISDMKKQTKQDDGTDFIIYSKDDNGLGNPPPLTESNPIVEQYGAVPNPQDDSTNATPGSTSGSASQVVSHGDIDDPQSRTRKQPDPFDIEITVENDQLGMSPSKKIKKGNEEKGKVGEGKMEVEQESKEVAEARQKEEENLRKEKAERNNQIDEYLKDGPLVYELYSILVHSGGAYGGHYYAYIKSFEDGKWYNFNDTSVSGIDQKEIPAKTFGGGKSANAYMLLYRQVSSVEEEKFNLSESAIPAYLKKFIEEENKKFMEQEMQRVEKAKNMSLRVYNKLEVKYVPAHFDETLRSFQKKAFDVYNITEKPENVRLRIYQPITDARQDTFTNKEDKTLSELKVTSNKCFIIEVKKDDEEFDEYDADKTYYKVALWRENLSDLTEDTLKPEKIFVHKDGTLKDLTDGISSKFNIPKEHVRLVKKIQIGGFANAEIINEPENMDKKYSELKMFEGSIFFAERTEDPNFPILWKEEFERDAYNYRIKFNSPHVENEIITDYPHFVMIDARKSIRELKTEICKKLNLSENEVLIRKGGRMGAEIKDLRQTIVSANFVNGSSIFVEFGKPTVVGEMRVFVSLAVKREDDDDQLMYNFEDLFELIISGDDNASEVKQMIADQAKRTKGITWDPKKMRLREKIGVRLAKVYRDSALKTQGVSDKKQVSIELLDEPDNIGTKDQLAICRIWNPSTLELGARFEVIIDRTKSLRHLADKIYEKNQDVKIENMMGCKVLGAWKFIRYDLLFQEWVNLDDDTCSVSAYPLYFNADGVIIFLKDKTLKEKELTDDEKKNIGVARVHHKTDHTPGGGGYSSYKHKETSMKIHVKKKEVAGENQNAGDEEKGASLNDVGEVQASSNSQNAIQGDADEDDTFKPFF